LQSKEPNTVQTGNGDTTGKTHKKTKKTKENDRDTEQPNKTLFKNTNICMAPTML